MRRYLRGYAVRDTSTGEDEPVPFVLATEGRKDDGIDLRMDNLDLERFRDNPILGYGHDYWGRDALPIGRVDQPRVDDGRLVGGLVFDREDEFADRVERKVRNGFLNAVSVGFDAADIDQAGVPATWRLFEVSVVPLPMDPDAVADDGRSLALVRMLSDTRAGTGLPTSHRQLVEDAIQALSNLVDAAGSDTGGGATHQASPAELRRRRLALAERGL
ncbi:hypothetical protein H0B56_12130 [Haloechinothrix sp. YIM 98757]|uniref:Phage prohead protease, HK97 family n=1 Tax=Haloechinothrix aidingensis TaxID=2752311 RepID=A0A838AAM5_9PSEU|nr:hypothetical protein [Haloechinothrix aidingensis]MBA0126290.1 hypothetical protein [Haloechinothrix aidingensis]